MKRALLTLAMIVAATGCDNSGIAALFGKGVVGGTGTTVGAAIADFLLGLVNL